MNKFLDAFQFIFILIDRALARFFIVLIKIYQKTLSLDHGPMKKLYPHGFCRFHPTCSQYGIDALTKYGYTRGMIKTIWRILRCNPWNAGGNDNA